MVADFPRKIISGDNILIHSLIFLLPNSIFDLIVEHIVGKQTMNILEFLSTLDACRWHAVPEMMSWGWHLSVKQGVGERAAI